MKVDKGVCTTTPATQQIGDAAEGVEEAIAVKSAEEKLCCPGSKHVADKAERYGVVFSTLMENKMQAIKRQSADYAGAKKKQSQFKIVGGGRITSKFIPSCVRRNSLTEEPHIETTGEDVEMGFVNDGLGRRVRDDKNMKTSNETQEEYKSMIDDSATECRDEEFNKHETKNTSDIISDNVSIQSVNSIGTAFSIPIAPPFTPKPLSDARLRLLDAKSISAQASPVLPRMLNHPADSSLPPSSTTPLNEATKPAALFSSSSSSRHAVPSSAQENPRITQSTFTITENMASQPITKTHRGYRSTTVTQVPTTTAASTPHGGFISNFNELTSSNNYSNLININVPVITSTITHHKKKVSAPIVSRSTTGGGGGFGRRPSMATSAVLEYEQRMDRKWPYSSASEMIMADSGSVCSGRQEWKTSRRKFRHRGSDPVLIYPSSSGLSQCLLTMPPNQSLQIKYDDNTLYDVSLELDRKSSKKNGAGTSGRKSTHRHHHDGYRHHHHHHRHSHRHNGGEHGEQRSQRHRKRILVHDLDTQRVKVIDPDDLSQRARWTIVSTACLLLIMCLLLVGITLRMAPLIDDMVRQENERLMRESYERGRFLQNLTDETAAVVDTTLNVQP